MDPSPTPTGTEIKRKRTQNACDQCSRRKIKCSGEKPNCEACTKAKVSCSYTIKEPKKRNVRTGYMASITERLQQVEQKLESQGAIGASLSHQSPMPFQISFYNHEHTNDPSLGLDLEASVSSLTSVSETTKSLLSETPIIVPIAPFEQEFLSKEMARMTASKESVSEATYHMESMASRDGGLDALQTPILLRDPRRSSLNRSLSAGASQAPPNWKLLDVFFTHVYPYIQIIPKEAFYSIAESEPQILMNAMYAMAAKYEHMNGCPTNIDVGKEYFEDAKKEAVEAIESSSLSTIHALYLMGYYAFCKSIEIEITYR